MYPLKIEARGTNQDQNLGAASTIYVDYSGGILLEEILQQLSSLCCRVLSIQDGMPPLLSHRTKNSKAAATAPFLAVLDMVGWDGAGRSDSRDSVSQILRKQHRGFRSMDNDISGSMILIMSSMFSGKKTVDFPATVHYVRSTRRKVFLLASSRKIRSEWE